MLDLFSKARVRPDKRPYQLSIEEFGQLCHVYHAMCQDNPKLANFKMEQSEREEVMRTIEDDEDVIDFNKL